MFGLEESLRENIRGKKLERNGRKKSEEKYKIDLKSINHFYVLLHTHFIYFNFLI